MSRVPPGFRSWRPRSASRSVQHVTYRTYRVRRDRVSVESARVVRNAARGAQRARLEGAESRVRSTRMPRRAALPNHPEGPVPARSSIRAPIMNLRSNLVTVVALAGCCVSGSVPYPVTQCPWRRPASPRLTKVPPPPLVDGADRGASARGDHREGDRGAVRWDASGSIATSSSATFREWPSPSSPSCAIAMGASAREPVPGRDRTRDS